MAREEFAPGMEKVLFRIESTRRMAARFRIAALALTLAALFGIILHSAIPYTPTFPMVVLVSSLACLVAGTRANWISQGFQQFDGVASGLARSAVTGGGIMLMWSSISAIAGIAGGKGSIAGQHGSALLLNLSWPAAVISLVAIGFGTRTYWRIRKLPR